ncbi:MAG: S8 family serine peptidase [Anaerolineae bacterium]
MMASPPRRFTWRAVGAAAGVGLVACLLGLGAPVAVSAGDLAGAVPVPLGADATGESTLSDVSGEPAEVCSADWIHALHAVGNVTGGRSVGQVALTVGDGGRLEASGALAEQALFVTSADTDAYDEQPPVGPSQDSRYPHDPYFRIDQRESLMAMGALDAWDTSRGGSDVTIAVISTGVDYDHADLAAKIWRNEDEIPGNGLDDDGNGYVDDVRGWNFASLGEDAADPTDAPRYGKGTMMAGIAAADTNNGEGVAGVSWGARIMPLRTMTLVEGEDGAFFVGTVRNIVESVCYAANNGARVVLIGGYLYDPESAVDDVDLLRQAIDYAHRAGAVIVASAGDCALPQPFCPPQDQYGVNPTIIPAAFGRVIAAQTYARGVVRRAEASYGPWVDITAPGESFRATGAGDAYPYIKPQRATSDFGAAHIAGVVAVMRSVNADLSPYRVEELLCQSADRKVGGPYEGSPLRNDEWGCGVVDFERAVEITPPKIAVTPTQVRVVTDGSQPWPVVAFDNSALRAARWVVNPERATWLLPEPVDDVRDTVSRAAVTADIERLRTEQGPLQSGWVYTATLKACPLGWEEQVDADQLEELCQLIPYELVFVDRFASTLFMPLVARP